ncbi:hypothetical protein JTB14_029142 [Gonioctena quinquepunctata]|nr:hypothetical protein JTB14_029142 [Gonioctena quinquepunctata]
MHEIAKQKSYLVRYCTAKTKVVVPVSDKTISFASSKVNINSSNCTTNYIVHWKLVSENFPQFTVNLLILLTWHDKLHTIKTVDIDDTLRGSGPYSEKTPPDPFRKPITSIPKKIRSDIKGSNSVEECMKPNKAYMELRSFALNYNQPTDFPENAHGSNDPRVVIHVGIPGNEQVDRIAHESMNEPTIHEQDLKSHMKSAVHNLWSSEWRISGSKLEEIKDDIKPWKIINRQRKHQIIIIRLCTGHTRYTHEHLLKKEEEKM